jgi:hypothetical protein
VPAENDSSNPILASPGEIQRSISECLMCDALFAPNELSIISESSTKTSYQKKQM